MNRPFVRKTLLLGALLLVAAFCLQSVAMACPTCKDSLAQHDPARAGLVRGYFWSILFMMSMPFLILGGVGSYFYYEIRRARKGGQVRFCSDSRFLGR